MEIHHGKHHAAYVANLNKAVAESPDLAREAGETLIAMLDSLPEKVRTAVRNNGGGHVNHTLFWQMMTKNGGGQPKGEVAQAIDQAFGSFNAFQDAFTKAALSQFGSGWAWLTATNQGQLYVESSANQDSPYMPLRAAAVLHPTANPAGLPKRVPLLGVDVWEHAYYLKYQNRRADYLAAFFNVIHWEFVNARFRQAMGRPD
jgi:Fe-Mn family superoxide dismutase